MHVTTHKLSNTVYTILHDKFTPPWNVDLCLCVCAFFVGSPKRATEHHRFASSRGTEADGGHRI